MSGRRSVLDWICEAIALAALAGMLGFAAASWSSLPEQIADHFGASGKPNDWGSKNILWLLSFVCVGTYILLTLASRYQGMINLPMRVNREAPEVRQLLRSMTSVLKAVLMLLFFSIMRGIVNTGLGRAEGLGVLFLPIFLAGTFLPLTVYLAKLRKFRK